jgi:hypothetical protein
LTRKQGVAQWLTGALTGEEVALDYPSRCFLGGGGLNKFYEGVVYVGMGALVLVCFVGVFARRSVCQCVWQGRSSCCVCVACVRACRIDAYLDQLTGLIPG